MILPTRPHWLLVCIFASSCAHGRIVDVAESPQPRHGYVYRFGPLLSVLTISDASGVQRATGTVHVEPALYSDCLVIGVANTGTSSLILKDGTGLQALPGRESRALVFRRLHPIRRQSPGDSIHQIPPNDFARFEVFGDGDLRRAEASPLEDVSRTIVPRAFPECGSDVACADREALGLVGRLVSYRVSFQIGGRQGSWEMFTSIADVFRETIPDYGPAGDGSRIWRIPLVEPTVE